jgi:hypothetical protein
VNKAVRIRNASFLPMANINLDWLLGENTGAKIRMKKENNVLANFTTEISET